MQWLKKAEYFSLFSTVVGTAVAAFTQQIVYAATPMTLTLCLSFKQQQDRQKTIDRLQYLVATLHHQLELVALPSPTEIKLFEDSLSMASGDLLSTSKNRRHLSGSEREIKVIERLERLELILYRLEESDALSITRSDLLLLEGQISSLAQEFNLLLDKIALEHNLQYSELKSVVLQDVKQITEEAIANQSHDLAKMMTALATIQAKLQHLEQSVSHLSRT